jgi:phosphoribosylformylglycinamidine synthase subunit PurL
VVRIKGSNRALAVKTDCNGRYVYLNPRVGGRIAVAEAARNVVCTGAKPVAVTNCLNFGNPYKPEVYWVFKEAVGGMGDACSALQTPVTGGNVSLYNENPKGAVFPTPTIGMLGIVEDVAHITTAALTGEHELLYIGAPRRGLGGSDYLSHIHGLTEGDAPHLDLDFEVKLQNALLDAIRAGLVRSAHDVSDGGLAVTLAEMCIFGGIGAHADLSKLGDNPVEVLFSEAQSGVVVAVAGDDLAKAIAHFEKAAVPAVHIGRAGGGELVLSGLLSMPVEAMKERYEGAIPGAMEGR